VLLKLAGQNKDGFVSATEMQETIEAKIQAVGKSTLIA